MDGQLCYGVTTMTQPDLSIPPQFTAAYWEAAPRKRVPTTIMETKRKDGLIQIVFVNNMAITRRAEEIRQLIFAGTNVEVEMIGEGLVTGMYLPDVKGWAFRMTAQNLADYARDYTEQEQAKQAAATQQMRAFLTKVIETYLVTSGGEVFDADGTDVVVVEAPIDVEHMADHVMAALQSGGQQ